MTPDSSTNMSVNGYAVRNAARILKKRYSGSGDKPKGEKPSEAPFPLLFQARNRRISILWKA